MLNQCNRANDKHHAAYGVEHNMPRLSMLIAHPEAYLEYIQH